MAGKTQFWTDERKSALALATSDEQMTTLFPNKSIANLRNRRSIFRKQLGLTPAKVKITVDNLEKRQKLLEILKKGPARDKDLSEALGVSTAGVWDLADALQRSGYVIRIEDNVLHFMGQQKTSRRTIVPSFHPKHRIIKIAVVSDTRIGSRYYQGDLHATVIAKCEAEDVDIMLHAGNVFGGKVTTKYKDDNFCQLAEEQVEEAVAYWPHSSKFRQYLLAGQTDLSFSTGKDAGRDMLTMLVQQASEADSKDEGDLVVAGALKQDFQFRNVRVRLMHPMTDRPIYAKSYRPQSILRSIATSVQQFGSAKREKPDIVIMGGFGVGAALRKRYGIRTFLVPSLQSPTTRQSEHEIAPEIGFAIFTLKFNKDGNLDEVIPEFFNLNPHHTPQDNHLVGVNDLKCDLSEQEQALVAELMSGTFTSEGQLSRRLNVSHKDVRSLLERISACGLSPQTVAGSTNIILNRAHRDSYKALPLSIFDGITLKAAFASDTHLCSKWERLPALREAYCIMDNEDVVGPYHAGDFGDGAGFTGYRGHRDDVEPAGITDQQKKMVEEYPRRKKIDSLTGKPEMTRVIMGNHDAWALTASGYHVLHALEELRPDIKFVGGPEETSGIVDEYGFNIRLYHPAGGGSYADSFKLQRGLEDELNYESNILDEHLNDIADKASSFDVFAVGHYHFFTAMFTMGVAAMMLPSFKGKDRFHKEHWLTPDIGFVIAELTKDAQGNLIRFAPRFFDLSHIK
ncbi:MAG: hypothetical protein A3A80_03435 [Candidatus Terrybacteria bacterium RIFCSPLOWO2_01_FULL_44_24]|uniref:Calcineurin-like phosphoesterase domain-containing protein n=1 Tax=Candidatus Terrybacteria bacterium RIFCSPHIGHO2_01_FULL_43_35 TaxID=1802361 RepID=A0A1G2PDI2_9BACT|nr:MAG: hypothetical protein A2828_00350 [Candidatus Terrybacteria bacterium RIFCSPHIGHO2_01_FULL_43_35]OHA49736.1 MAG: hypothetical protein A3B75_01925 [Candidatus Terrybacteria bacterium RIFCSPHIGHO2_02_FULL_43_14]OHA51559.1 MAG: hypothetical protein A3A80_03435 [Candidatus Terrybacteria bacterium RIFCSPLOWO2_01_FULL_44_24]